jgi:hypothetical protein
LAAVLSSAGTLRVCFGPECCISQFAVLYGLCSEWREGAGSVRLM